jgi:succinyl-diaminopimelate desuccinylase
VRRRFGSGPVVALNAHGDVVPPGEGWSVDPYGAVIRDGWMYGRGVAVSKSDFATYAFALKALEAAGQARGTVELHFTYDEEAGGAIGPAWLLSEYLTRPDFAISAGFSYAITTAHNGCLHLEVAVKGKSAHAARPETGHDALAAATGILAALYAVRPELARIVSKTPGIGSPNLTIGLIKGGINTNVVPDLVAFRLDRRIIPEENPAAVESALRAHIAEASGARDPWRRHRGGRGAALYRRAPLQCRGHPDRALRRRPAQPPRGERPPRRRAPEARRPLQGDQDRGPGLGRFARRLRSSAYA